LPRYCLAAGSSASDPTFTKETRVMKRHLVRCLAVGLALCAAPALARAQTPEPETPDSASSQPARARASVSTRGPSRFYFGGSVGLMLSNDLTRVSVQPMVGYKLGPKASVGAKLGYEYYNDHRADQDFESHNYGGSVFTRYRVIPQAYAHAEFEYTSYDFGDARVWVPFLLLGGGYTQPISKKSQFMVEVLFDVLQDSNSPYDAWEPVVNVGVGVGF
jgi:hypothetical protein